MFLMMGMWDIIWFYCVNSYWLKMLVMKIFVISRLLVRMIRFRFGMWCSFSKFLCSEVGMIRVSVVSSELKMLLMMFSIWVSI